MANEEDYSDQDDRDDFEDVRHDLNLDEATMEDALRTYQEIKVNFKLEGEKMDWIACAIYSSCRSRMTQTMSGRGSKIEGNMVSLTRILRSCRISLARFFNKMKNWMSMAKLSAEMHSKLDQLERNFNVTAVIFKKYKPMFEDIFKCVDLTKASRFATKKPKGLRKQPLTSLDIFTFCWTLFVYIKSRYSQINDDLVNSYHLLVVCLDYCYSCVLSFDNYKDIVNSNFYDALAADLTTDPRSQNNDNRVSIIDTLCAKWHGIDIEVKQIKKHWFEPFLKGLTEKEETPVVRKRANGIIDCDVVDFNFKYFKREYETYVLTIGDFDECVFLNETASEELGTEEFNGYGSGGRGGGGDGDTIDSILLVHMKPIKSFTVAGNSFTTTNSSSNRINHDQPNGIMPMTPLSYYRDYLTGRTPVKHGAMDPLTPITSATACISRLQSILMNQKSAPSDGLRELLAKCRKGDPAEAIARMVTEMGDVFLAAFNDGAPGGGSSGDKANSENKDPSSSTVGVIRRTEELQYVVSDNFPKRRLELAVAFFYRVLENILNNELRKVRKFPNFDSTEALVRVLEQHVFLRSLFACSLEIVLHSYSPVNRLFPWILNIFNNAASGASDLKLHSFHFYKVIELIIRSEELLSRELVKYLNTVEEAILERYAWTADSPLWALIKAGGPGAVPSFEETQSFSSPAPKILAAAAAAAVAAAAAPSGSGSLSLPVSHSPAARSVKRQIGFDTTNQEVTSGAAAPAPAVSAPFVVSLPVLGKVPAAAAPTDGHPISNGSTTTATSSSPPVIVKVEEGGEAEGPTTTTAANHNIKVEDGGEPEGPTTIINNSSGTSAAAAPVAVAKPPPLPPVNLSGQQLKLFFRKVYNVASLRLRDLTKRLAVDEVLVQMMWTCLLHSLRTYPELMAEHHLDQLIMCSVYCVCKLNTGITFSDIIKEYRMQPQAKSFVYRNVLLAVRENLGGEQQQQPSSPAKEEKPIGDLIKFYNMCFYQRLTEQYLLQFKIDKLSAAASGGRGKQTLTLSPMPKRNPLVSPLHQSPIRRVSAAENVFVSPLPTTSALGGGGGLGPLSPGRAQSSYRIQYGGSGPGGPSVGNELREVNNAMARRQQATAAAAAAAASSAGGRFSGALSSLGGPGPSGFGGGGGNTKRAAKRLLVLEGDGSNSNSSSSSSCSSSSASQMGVGGKSQCLSRKINDIWMDRTQFQLSAAATANVMGVSGGGLVTTSAAAESMDVNSNDSLQFPAAGTVLLNNHHHHHQFSVPINGGSGGGGSAVTLLTSGLDTLSATALAVNAAAD